MQSGQIAGAGEPRLAERIPASAVLTGRAVAPGAGTAELSRHFADMGGGKIRVMQGHRPVDQADDDLGTALASFH
jgi:hypothetical protein